MSLLVIGGSGFLGGHVCRRARAAGLTVATAGRGALPGSPAHSRVDLAQEEPGKIAAMIASVAPDAVVNCAGVLQDNANDSTAAVHGSSPAALYTACARASIKRVVHISAIGVDRQAPTAFSRSKAQGDAALMASGLDWVVLRPSVVVGRAAYGGSALFRGLAALPLLPRIA